MSKNAPLLKELFCILFEKLLRQPCRPGLKWYGCSMERGCSAPLSKGKVHKGGGSGGSRFVPKRPTDVVTRPFAEGPRERPNETAMRWEQPPGVPGGAPVTEVPRGMRGVPTEVVPQANPEDQETRRSPEYSLPEGLEIAEQEQATVDARLEHGEASVRLEVRLDLVPDGLGEALLHLEPGHGLEPATSAEAHLGEGMEGLDVSSPEAGELLLGESFELQVPAEMGLLDFIQPESPALFENPLSEDLGLAPDHFGDDHFNPPEPGGLL